MLPVRDLSSCSLLYVPALLHVIWPCPGAHLRSICMSCMPWSQLLLIAAHLLSSYSLNKDLLVDQSQKLRASLLRCVARNQQGPACSTSLHCSS